MNLDLTYDFGNPIAPGWALTLQINGKVAATLYDHEPSAKEVVEFINELGPQIEAIYAAN